MSLELRRQRAIDYVNQLPTGAIDESACVPNWTSWSLGGGDISRDLFRKVLKDMMSLFPAGFKIWVIETTAEEDRVAVKAKSEGILVNGTRYANDYIFTFKFEGDLISHCCEFADSKHIADVLIPVLGAQLAGWK